MVYHKFTLSRSRYLWFWKGQIICRIFGHRLNDDHTKMWCGRCGLAYEEIYGLAYFEHLRKLFATNKRLHSDVAERAATLSGLYNCQVCGEEKCRQPGICAECLIPPTEDEVKSWGVA